MAVIILNCVTLFKFKNLGWFGKTQNGRHTPLSHSQSAWQYFPTTPQTSPAPLKDFRPTEWNVGRMRKVTISVSCTCIHVRVESKHYPSHVCTHVLSPHVTDLTICCLRQSYQTLVWLWVYEAVPRCRVESRQTPESGYLHLTGGVAPCWPHGVHQLIQPIMWVQYKPQLQPMQVEAGVWWWWVG